MDIESPINKTRGSPGTSFIGTSEGDEYFLPSGDDASGWSGAVQAVLIVPIMPRRQSIRLTVDGEYIDWAFIRSGVFRLLINGSWLLFDAARGEESGKV
jgi:hypothetical protein